MWFYGYFTNGYTVLTLPKFAKKFMIIQIIQTKLNWKLNIFIFLKEQNSETQKTI